MVEFAKRPEVTVSTMGKVHNPSGEGVRAISSQAQAKMNKHKALLEQQQQEQHSNDKATELHETRVREGTAKRNITRKKTAEKDTGNYDSSHKKQGGHGKGKWKEVMDPSYVEEIPIAKDDPLYDAAEDSTAYILSSTEQGAAEQRGYDPGTAKAIYGPMLTLCEFKVQLGECIHEYFDSSDTDEVIRTLDELGCREYHSEIVKKAISLALDQGSRQRELISRLLPCLHPTPMSMDDLAMGFENLLDSLDDLQTDVPDAPTIVASFLARAVVDEVLPPVFLSEQNNNRPGDPVIEKAVTLLSREHCTARLEKVWGPGDGRPVEELKKDMDQLLQEYLLSHELDEAARCVKELEAPHFHHELVKRGVFAAMEVDGKKIKEDSEAHHVNLEAMAALFGFLVRNVIVSDYQVAKGVDRLHQIMPDLKLDVPAAPALLAEFESLAKEQSLLTNGKGTKKVSCT